MTFLMGSSLLLAGLLAVSIPIIIHLLHGAYNVGNLAIYTAAACVIAVKEG